MSQYYVSFWGHRLNLMKLRLVASICCSRIEKDASRFRHCNVALLARLYVDRLIGPRKCASWSCARPIGVGEEANRQRDKPDDRGTHPLA